MPIPKLKSKFNSKSPLYPLISKKNKNLLKKFPKKYLLIYSKTTMNYLRKKYKLKKIKELSNYQMEYYIHNNISIVRMVGIGSPHAVVVFEELIAFGGKIFLNIGTAGGLCNEDLYICNKALRDEGTSYHYKKTGKYSFPDKILFNKFKKYLENNNIKYSIGTTWTIDAPYRETIKEINHYKKIGIKIVEMETSALYTVAKIKNVKILSSFVVSDLVEKKWTPKFDNINTKNNLKSLAVIGIKFLNSLK